MIEEREKDVEICKEDFPEARDFSPLEYARAWIAWNGDLQKWNEICALTDSSREGVASSSLTTSKEIFIKT